LLGVIFQLLLFCFISECELPEIASDLLRLAQVIRFGVLRKLFFRFACTLHCHENCAEYLVDWTNHQKVPMPCGPLWASLNKNKTETDRQENRQKTILIVLKRYFVNLTNKSGGQNPLKKRGVF
jgi:hypothetical protein